MKKSELVFIPSPGISHTVSTIEFAKCITDRDDRLLIKILLMNFPLSPSDGIYAKSLVGTEPRIQLIDLPQVKPPFKEVSPMKYYYTFIESCIPHVRDTLTYLVSISTSRVSALILDFFCLPMMDVANELGLPSYMYLPTSTGFLSLILNHKYISDQIRSTDLMNDPNIESLSLPGLLKPIPPRVLLQSSFASDSTHADFLKLVQRFQDPKGIIVNSFAELEPQAVGCSLSTSDEKMPPVYMVGPVLNLKGQTHQHFLAQSEHDRIMKWLDEQPPASVVFLCFGSLASFGAAQVGEIALGIEKTACKFLWSIRPPQVADKTTTISEAIMAVLPAGFVERTNGRGTICGWAPQVDVLAHKAVGGFVSHCGWNSILESLWHGVPVATFPAFSEQPLNAFRMAREFGLAVEIRSDYRDSGGVVTAEEIERGLRRLMEGENGSELRKKVKDTKEMARKAVAEGGSSFNTVGKLIKDIIGSH